MIHELADGFFKINVAILKLFYNYIIQLLLELYNAAILTMDTNTECFSKLECGMS